MSNTAGGSDEWHSPFPGTDGAIALAMCNVIISEGLHDVQFIERWTNVTVQELRDHLSSYTAEWAERVSGVAADDITRIAIEFASAPAATTICNRGSSPHLNGFYNDRHRDAQCLGREYWEEVVGVGRHGEVSIRWSRHAMPPGAKTHSVLEDPPEYPYGQRVATNACVGEIVYLYLLQDRAKPQPT